MWKSLNIFWDRYRFRYWLCCKPFIKTIAVSHWCLNKTVHKWPTVVRGLFKSLHLSDLCLFGILVVYNIFNNTSEITYSFASDIIFSRHGWKCEICSDGYQMVRGPWTSSVWILDTEMLLQSGGEWQMHAVKPTVKVSFLQKIAGCFDWCMLYGRHHQQLGHMPLKTVTRLYSLVNCVKHNAYDFKHLKPERQALCHKMCFSPTNTGEHNI